jgi:hypothetical protein
MNLQEVIKVANANNSLSVARDLNSNFLAHCAKNGTQQEFATAIEVSEQSLSIAAFGYKARANARHVRTSDGRFSTEYVFRVRTGETETEVSRFYLTTDGRVAEDVQGQTAICDYNNLYLAKHICGRVLLGTLRSSLFAASSREGG